MLTPATGAHANRLARARRRFERAQQTWLARFVARLFADDVPRLAVLLAWGSLGTLLPLVIVVSGFGGMLLRDRALADQLTRTLAEVFPGASAGLVERAVEQARRNGPTAGIIGLGLLLWNGSSFFANMESVFNLAYRVPDRNLVLQRARSLGLLLLVSAFVAVSTVAFTIGGILGSASDYLLGLLPTNLVTHADLVTALSWLVVLVDIFASFLLLYRVLPNCPVTWRHALPGAATAAVLFLLIVRLFPLYLELFGHGFEIYAAFGAFLLLMLWTYLLGIVLILGAELNAFVDPRPVGTRRWLAG
jgi:membrane protein